MKATALFRRALQAGIGTVLASGFVMVHAHSHDLNKTPHNIDFHPAVTYDSPSRPCELGRGDFNGDGFVDLATTNQMVSEVQIFLNNRAGGFPTRTNYPIATPCGIDVGDINGDNALDIVATDQTNNRLSVLIGNGDGTFQIGQSFGTGVRPTDVILSDFNHDAKLDAVVTNQNSQTISILLGNGNGTFATQVGYNVQSAPTLEAVGDLNGDGYADVVVANANSNSVSVLHNNVNGSFATAVNYPVGDIPHSAGIGDLDGDGDNDVIAVNRWGQSMTRLINNGNGSFSPLAPTIFLQGPGDIEISDIDSDGLLDILATNTVSDIDLGTVSIYFGLGNAAFSSPQVITSGVHPTSLIYADLNNDNLIDIATSNFYGSSISVLLRKSQLFSTFLPLVTDNRPLFPIAINPIAQPLSPITQQGQIYYTTTLTINSSLPTTGRFYLSALSNAVAEVRVDDQFRVWADDQVLYEKTLTTPQVVEISRSELESWRNQELTITFRDVAGSVYGNSPVWLIWVP